MAKTISPIKKTFTYAEKSEEQRKKYLKKLKRVPVKKRVYVDESGVEKDILREYARSLKGQKVEDVRRGCKFRRTNVVAALCCNKIVAPLCYNHTTTGDFFESWFQDSLLKEVERGCTIIMDNASFHRKKVLKKLTRNTGIRLLFLSPYSPDYNPIEIKWANMKRALVDLLPKNKTIENAIYQYFST